MRGGLAHETALVYGTDGDTILLVGAKSGASSHPAWYHNLKAHPECDVIASNRSGRYTARELAGADRERAWEIMRDVFPGYGSYQERSGGRVLPVLALERV